MMVLKLFVNVVKGIHRNPIYILIFLGALTLLSGIRIKTYLETNWKHKYKSIYPLSGFKMERSLLPSEAEDKNEETVNWNDRKRTSTTTKDVKGVVIPDAKREKIKVKSNNKNAKTLKSRVTPTAKAKTGKVMGKDNHKKTKNVKSSITATVVKEKNKGKNIDLKLKTVKPIVTAMKAKSKGRSTHTTTKAVKQVMTAAEKKNGDNKIKQASTKSMNHVTTSTAKKKNVKKKGNKVATLPFCDHKSKLLGRVDYVMPDETPTIQETEDANPLVLDGGHFKPSDCISKWKVAILIPFRNRDVHLYHFLQHMHPLLQRQQLDYRVYIINQFGNNTFNRGKLINIGFTEMKNDYDYDCVVLHDVDLLLENDYALYKCLEQPLHLVSAVQKNNYTIEYKQYFGGVTEFSTRLFEQIDGFSNNYWGWGAEDDDLLLRVRKAKKLPYRYSEDIARYYMIFHTHDEGNEVNPDRYDRLFERYHSEEKDGLSNLKYKVISKEEHPLYTNLTVDVLAPSHSLIADEKTVKLEALDRKMSKMIHRISFKETTP